MVRIIIFQRPSPAYLIQAYLPPFIPAHQPQPPPPPPDPAY